MSEDHKKSNPWVKRALEREPGFLSVMMDTVSALVIVLDKEGFVLGFNQACQETSGYTFEELAGRPFWEDLLPPDEHIGVMRVFNRLRAGEFPNQHTNFWLTKEGERRLIDWSNTALLGSDGEVDMVIGTGIDVSARYQAELRLQESEGRFRRLTEASFEGLIINDGGVILDSNVAAAELVGLSVEELIGREANDFVPERWREEVAASIDAERSTPYEIELVRRDGEVIPVELLGRTVPYKGRRVRVTAIRDISLRKAAEREREELLQREQAAREEAERAVGLRDDFLSVASHELRSPVTSLQLALDNVVLLADRLDQDPGMLAALRDAAVVAQRQSKRLTDMVSDLLDVTRLQSGRQKLDLQLTDLGRLIAAVVDDMRPQMEGVGCPLVLDAAQGVEGYWDPAELARLVTNLLTNASKYGEGNQVDVAVSLAEEGALLVVRDRGIGIPEDKQETIFEPYCRAVCPRKYEGVGLGLFIVRGIAEAHGGTVQVESAPEQGARFTVTLPLGEADEQGSEEEEG